MKRLLTVLLGLWVFTAPAVCAAFCGDGPTPASRRLAASPSTTTELPMEPCHRASGDAGNDRAPQDRSTPGSNADCCADGSSNAFQVEARKAPLNPLAHVLGAPGDLARFQSPALPGRPRTESHCTPSPYLRANPPLLI